MRITKPKFVKKAKQWCVTVLSGETQKQHWFDTKQEAEQFFKEQVVADKQVTGAGDRRLL